MSSIADDGIIRVQLRAFIKAWLGMIGLCAILSGGVTGTDAFKTTYTPATGLGVTYNASSCAECHNSPTIGGSSRVTVTRAGHRDRTGKFFPAPNGGVLRTHFTDPKYLEQPGVENIQSARVAINLLGDGYVEAIEDNEILGIARDQSNATNGQISGHVVYAPILEAPGKMAVGRFGWKSQHASLLSAVADALRTELGMSSYLYPPEADPGEKAARNRKFTLNELAAFVRGTQYPPRDEALAASDSAQAGSSLFGRIGCSVCHVDTFVTAPAGARIHGGRYTVPERLGGKTIHPYSDFLLHDVDTGDGIVQSAAPKYADQSTANKFRTAPLWGVRFRTWMMHDGRAVTYHQAIMRHAGEATEVIERYQRLPPEQKHQLWEFLNSL